MRALSTISRFLRGRADWKLQHAPTSIPLFSGFRILIVKVPFPGLKLECIGGIPFLRMTTVSGLCWIRHVARRGTLWRASGQVALGR